MRKFLSATALALSFAMSGTGFSQELKIVKPKAVVEVFTSQGCHSCPPADKIVGEFAKTNEILAISTHVDYWDYLGWKDIYASSANTQRQYGYARTLRETQVYTPQAVINGRTHEVGSRGASIDAAIEKYTGTNAGLVVPIDISVNDNSIDIAVEDHPSAKDTTLYIISMKSAETVKIKRGENSGKTITYHNVLKKVQPIGMVKPGGLKMQFPIAELRRGGNDRFAIMLQASDKNGNPKEIVGAVYIEGL